MVSLYEHWHKNSHETSNFVCVCVCVCVCVHYIKHNIRNSILRLIYYVTVSSCKTLMEKKLAIRSFV
jgi:hypothetical protein